MTPKQQALRDLDRARSLLGAHMHLASEEFSPKAIAQRSWREHPWLWTGMAALGGLFLVRQLLPASKGKFERDNLSASAKKSGLIALILPPMIAMGRQAAWKYGRHFLQSYLTQHISRHEGERPRA